MPPGWQHCPDHLLEHLTRGQQLRVSGSYRGRYAPSPTGVLHLGNLQTALLSWLQARIAGGQWILRIDDLDRPRNRSGAIERIQSDLRWLGLDWDEPCVFQSARTGFYDAWLAWLRRCGALFACRCTRRQLAGHIVYPGYCRDAAGHWGLEQERFPAWRLKVPSNDPRNSGDVLVRRSDRITAYHFATVIDEICLGITDVVRGSDLLDSLPSQLSIFDALGQESPRFHHGPLLRDQAGRKLSKRIASAGLEPLRRNGLEAADVIGQMASQLGLVPAGIRLSASELLREIDPKVLQSLCS